MDKQQDNSEKLKSLQVTMDKMRKDFGANSVMWMNAKADKVEVIPSGSLGVDFALGVGGFPKGRIVEIYGPESSGKTTLTIHLMAQAQKQGGICAIIDAEHAFDPEYASKLGVNVDSLLIAQPDYGEQALEIAERLINSGSLDVLVVDSVAALVPKSELEGDMGDSKMGLQARLMSQALRKLTSYVNKTKTCLVFINQLRDKIGVFYGPSETTTGGNALKFYSSVRIDIRRISQIKDGDQLIGNRTRVKIVKNKVAPPFKTAEFDMIFGEGISKIGEILDWSVELGIIEKNGAWFSYGGNKLGQGRENVRVFLQDNPGVIQDLEQQIRARMLSNNSEENEVTPKDIEKF